MTHGGGTRQMFELVHALPDQLLASAALEGLDGIGPRAADGRRIILCGMGGSAIAGDLVQPLLQDQAVSLTVWRDYGLPHWAGPGDLVLCSSYSGDTEETLSACREASRRGCARLAVTSGGRLAGIAHQDGFPAVILPAGLPPRASLGLGLGALTRVLGRLHLVPAASEAVAAAAADLLAVRDQRLAPVVLGGGEDTAPGPDPEGNPAVAELAAKLVDKVPVIYTAGGEAHAAGLRLKGQFNENSKCPALLAAFPELNHNDLVGWDLGPAERGKYVLLILRGIGDNERIDRRVELTTGLLADEFPEIHEIRSTATGVLGRVMSLVQYGDFLSCHLARLRGVDPVPVERIGRLKEALGQPD